ncbi:AAA family ATPase [Pseudenhygromyxa sp. WMMC2535]|uniref:ATP-binding protein n=1 Tax=Pseudenhygromyxa sp. WMMC2535 TaxID=2712867 RepID=UPI00155770CA|nr:AAA family ATPase [Pseudenhygromyxa sp. WMMC2535]NVB37642.1 AAA family ATPase [Pseudenhygromyxa sp. WMMC2535]
MVTQKSREPLDLGRLEALEPLGLEPGIIVWERFCVVDKVRFASPLWSVQVTDLSREFGRSPHHRVVLQFLPVSDRGRERIHRAVSADEQVQPRVRATVDLPGGVMLVHEPVDGEHLGALLPVREARALALALSGLLVRLHEAKVRGLELRLADLRQSEGRLRLEGFDHLLGSGSREDDLAAVLALLRRAAASHLGGLLEPPPRTAAELWGRARALSPGRVEGPVIPLSQHPPFVGRRRARQALEQSFNDALIARSSVTLVCGEQGVGKSRLLEEFASWLRSEDRALVLRGEYLRGCGESRGGLMGALGRLPEALAGCPPEVGERIRERLARREGALAGVLVSYAPALAELLGQPSAPPTLEFEEGFSRHAAAIAEGVRCIGSQGRPLVVLLDNLQLADRGSQAVLRRLLLDDRSHHTMIVAGLCGPAPAGLSDGPEDGPWSPQRDPQLLLRRISLESLTVAELERLLIAGLPGPVSASQEVAEVLHETSKGNPLVAWATLQSWIDRQVLVRGESEQWSLRRRKVAGSSPGEVFAQRVDDASLDERWLALLAAVAGGHVDEAWFQRVSGWDARRVAAAVAGLEGHGLMGKVGEASLRFPHELVREQLLARTPAGEIRRAHREIANWLASLGPRVSAARLAYHTDRALGQESHNDPKLAEMHLAAGREMLGVYDLERSGWHFTRALVERGKGDSRLAAVEGAADVALLGGKCEEAAQLYAEAVVGADDPLVASRIAAKAVHGLFRRSAAGEAANIGRLALARADRPLPEGELRQVLALARARAQLRFSGPRDEVEDSLAEQLCWLYTRLAMVLVLPDRRSATLCMLRALRLARGHQSPAAAGVLAIHGASKVIEGELGEGRAELDEATRLAEVTGSDWARGVVAHIRGHMIELASGNYEHGLVSLDQSVMYFRRTGDLSIAVSSMFFKVVYGRSREPLIVLHGWLDEATSLAENQGDVVLELGIEALRLLLRARAGARNIVEAAGSLAARLNAQKMISFEGYLPHAHLALALLEVGETARAREQIEQAFSRMVERDKMPEYGYELWLAIALVLVRTRAAREDDRRIDRALRALERGARRSPRLVAFVQLIRMRRAVAAGRRDRASAAAAALIAGLSEHGQIYEVHEAHRTLGELLRGSDVLAAREHVGLAQELADQLGLEQGRQAEREAAEELDAPKPRPRERSSRAHSAAYLRAVARNAIVEVAEVLEGSRPVLLETVGNVPWIYLRAEPELRVHGELVELQSLLVHLALCARDSVSEPEQLRAVGNLEELDESRAAKIPGALPGPWGRIAVSVVDASEEGIRGVTGGVSACRQVAMRMGGFLEVERSDESLTLAVYLPLEQHAGARSSEDDEVEAKASVFVLHPDPLIRETLAGAVSRLGYEVSSADPDEVDLRELPEVGVLFSDGEILVDYLSLLPAIPTLVEIGNRGVRKAKDFPLLRVPFALGELRRHLEGR